MERISEKDVCKEYGITPDILKANNKEEDVELFLKHWKNNLFTVFGVPIKCMVRSNG